MNFGRMTHLDGLRGVAAMIVVISHIAAGFVPATYFASEAFPAPQWQASFALSPFFVTINGSFAVYVFFVLSGYVLAGSALASRSSVLANCAARVVRLSLPCAVSILLAGALVTLKLNWVAEAADVVKYAWLRTYIGDYPLETILTEAAGYYYWSGSSKLNPILWTMQRELWGSLVIYVGFGLIRGKVAQLTACAVIASALVIYKLEPDYYLCFVAGSALYVLRNDLPSATWIGIAFLVAGLLLGGRPFATPTPGSFYFLPYVYSSTLYFYVWTLGAVCLLAGVLLSPVAKRLLGGRVGCFLGRISFSLYLVHFVLLKSLMAYLYVTFGHAGPIELAVSSLVYVIAVVSIGYVFTILVDEPATRLSRLVRVTRSGSGRSERMSTAGVRASAGLEPSPRSVSG